MASRQACVDRQVAARERYVRSLGGHLHERIGPRRREAVRDAVVARMQEDLPAALERHLRLVAVILDGSLLVDWRRDRAGVRHAGALGHLHLAAKHALAVHRQRDRRRRDAFLAVAEDGVRKDGFRGQADLVPAVGRLLGDHLCERGDSRDQRRGKDKCRFHAAILSESAATNKPSRKQK